MAKKQKSIETQVSDTILQEPIIKKIGEREYVIKPVSMATLIKISALTSEMPEGMPDGSVIEKILSVAHKCGNVALIAAYCILGVKYNKPSWIPKIKPKINEQDDLANYISVYMPLSEIDDLIAECLGTAEVQRFLALITFLTEVNLLRPTKKVIETTVFGQ